LCATIQKTAAARVIFHGLSCAASQRIGALPEGPNSDFDCGLFAIPVALA
jgi:hypothetical protein